MKAYVKPDLFCEDYVLNMSVAACQLQLGADGKPKYSSDEEAFELLQLGGFVNTEYCTTKVDAYGYYGAQITIGS